MGILHICNRTENWRTARYVIPFLEDKDALLRLVQKLNPDDTTPNHKIELELFWQGGRDLRLKLTPCDAKAADKAKAKLKCELIALYKEEFRTLREDIENFGCRFRNLKEDNYVVDKPHREDIFLSNVIHTEIDMVIQSENYLYIGEMKYEAPFSANSKHVLVHQLIRQYVVSKLLVSHQKCKIRSVKQFVVVKKKPASNQLDFVKYQGWLCDKNILTWNDLDRIRHDK